MNVLFVGLVALTTIALVIFVIGITKRKTGIVVFGFILMFAVATTGMLFHTTKTDSKEYRVVYTDESSIVVVDDSNGKTARFNLEKIMHSKESFQIGDEITVVKSGIGKAMYITTDQIIASHD